MATVLERDQVAVRCVACDADVAEIEHQPCIRCDDPVGDCCAVKEFRGGALLDFDAAGNPVVTPRTVHYLCPACAADIESEAAELARWRPHDTQARYDELVDECIASTEPQQPSPMACVQDGGTMVLIHPGTYSSGTVELTPIEAARVHAQLGAWLAAQKGSATAATVAGGAAQRESVLGVSLSQLRRGPQGGPT